jgi:hypothetical protein
MSLWLYISLISKFTPAHVEEFVSLLTKISTSTDSGILGESVLDGLIGVVKLYQDSHRMILESQLYDMILKNIRSENEEYS